MAGRLLKIGIVQPCPVSKSYEQFRIGGDVRHACEILTSFENQVDMVCFPEFYPYTGERELAQKARETGIYIIAGIIEETSEGCYNAATLFDRQGVVVGRQRKKYPTRPQNRIRRVKYRQNMIRFIAMKTGRVKGRTSRANK